MSDKPVDPSNNKTQNQQGKPALKANPQPNPAPQPQPAKPVPARPSAPQAGGPDGPKGQGTKVTRPVKQAKMKRRHWGMISSFCMYVIVPIIMIAYYLWVFAADQYASTVAFSVRTEETSSALELLGGITDLSGSSSSDTDILYEFLQSQQLVSDIDDEVGLVEMWSKPENDPFFAFNEDGAIEDLVEHWSRFVNITYDDSAGLIEVRVNAFAPDDATLIAQALFEKSSLMINGLSDIAREDAIRYSRQELDDAVELLRQARQSVTTFRNINRIVDPSVDISTQAGLLGSLEAQLAEALIDLDMLPGSRENDPRVVQAELRIEVIQRRIEGERAKLGRGEGGTGEVYANLIGEYERLVVDREFAEQRYASSQLSYDASLAEARRQSRYLAAYVLPTTAESSRFPERSTLLVMMATFVILMWATIILIMYSIKDRR